MEPGGLLELELNSAAVKVMVLVLPLKVYYRRTKHTTAVRFLAPTPGELLDLIFIRNWW